MLLLAPRGPARGRRPSGSPGLRDPAHRDGRHDPRGDRTADATSGGAEADLRPRRARPRRPDDPADPRAAPARRRGGQASSSTAFRARCPGGGARRDARRDRPRARRSSSSFRCPTRCVERLHAARGEEGRADDTPEAIAAAGAVPPRDRATRRVLPRGRATSSASTGSGRSTPSTPRSSRPRAGWRP